MATTVIPTDGTPAVMDFADAFRVLGIPASTAYHLNARGEFPVRVIKIGQRLRVTRHELEAFLRGES